MILYQAGRYQLAFIWRVSGSTLPRGALFAMPSVVLWALIRYFAGSELADWAIANPESGVMGVISSFLWFSLTFLLSFRCREAYGRFWEGAAELKQMSAEWFESASNLVAFSGVALKRKPDDEVTRAKILEFRALLARLMSLLHGVALRQIGSHTQHFQLLDVLGLDDKSLDYLTGDCCHFEINKAEVVLHWIQTLITDSIASEVIVVPPPILSRAFQTLSRGMVHLHRVRMIADIPFPFPFNQGLIVLLIVESVLVPLLLSYLIKDFLMAGVAVFLPCCAMWSLVFICGELEQPFGQDPNDLPLTMHQFDFNNSLLMLLDQRANTVPGILTGSSIEEHHLRDTFGDPESSTTIVYHARDKAPYRETLRGALPAGAARGATKEFATEFEHLTHNEAIAKIHFSQPDVDMAEVEGHRKQARERSDKQRMTRSTNTCDIRAGFKGRSRTQGSIFDISVTSSCETDWARTMPSRFAEALHANDPVGVLQFDMEVGNVGDMPRGGGAAPYVPLGSKSTAVTNSSPLVASAILHTVSERTEEGTPHSDFTSPRASSETRRTTPRRHSSSSRVLDFGLQHPCIYESDSDSGTGHSAPPPQAVRTASVDEARSPRSPSTRKRGSSPIPTTGTTDAASLLGC